MSLQNTYPRTPLQNKLFEPRLLEWSEIQERLVALYAAARANRTRTVALLGVFFFLATSVFAVSLLRISPAAALASAPAAAATDARPLEIHIAQNGLILLRSAKVVSIHGSTLMLSTTWGSTEFEWAVRTDAKQYESREFGTKFLSREGKRVSITDFRIGDLVTVTGTLDTAAKEPTIQGDSVRHTD